MRFGNTKFLISSLRAIAAPAMFDARTASGWLTSICRLSLARLCGLDARPSTNRTVLAICRTCSISVGASTFFTTRNILFLPVDAAPSSGAYSTGDRQPQQLPGPDHLVIQAVDRLRIVVSGNCQVQRIAGPQRGFVAQHELFRGFEIG